MEIINNQKYDQIISSFFKKHGFLKITTSEFKDNQYYKNYIGEDGKMIYEVNRKVSIPASVEVRTVKTNVYVDLFETEIWTDSNDFKGSLYMYQKY